MPTAVSKHFSAFINTRIRRLNRRAEEDLKIEIDAAIAAVEADAGVAPGTLRVAGGQTYIQLSASAVAPTILFIGPAIPTQGTWTPRVYVIGNSLSATIGDYDLYIGHWRAATAATVVTNLDAGGSEIRRVDYAAINVADIYTNQDGLDTDVPVIQVWILYNTSNPTNRVFVPVGSGVGGTASAYKAPVKMSTTGALAGATYTSTTGPAGTGRGASAGVRGAAESGRCSVVYATTF